MIKGISAVLLEDGHRLSGSKLPLEIYCYQQGMKAERERIIKELETLKDIVWQDTDSDKRIVRSNAWDKVDLMNKAIGIVKGGENEKI